MLTSKAFFLGTTICALFSFYALFYALYQTQLKFPDTTELNFLSQDKSPWFQRKGKVVFVIVDGLRFDFLLNYLNHEHMKSLEDNKFLRFNEAYFANPERYVVFRAYADLPTMTVLRVPCMMTGNVPRLGSVLTAFGALPSIEDSIPRQLFLQGKKSYFAGDPILPQYFPKYLTSDFTIGAFNVRDRFVDDPSHSFMNQKLKENDFDFLGGHFLEVDHAGHHSGLNTDLMSESIASMDKYLMEIINQIDDDTILLFGGDHGMTLEGLHGGGALEETETAIVAYHKKGFMKNKYKNLEKIMRSINETGDFVNQIDIVPTLSMLMGLPTPFSNMGQILNDLYPVGDYLSPQENCPEAAFLMQMLHDNHLNTLQVWNYFNKYYEGQDLYSKQEYSPAAEFFQNVEADYKTADQMIKENRQCEQAFQDVAISAIQKSQQLAKQVHDLVTNKPPQDLVIFWQAFLLLILVGVAYVFQVQYLYKTKDYESTSWTSPKTWDWPAVAKGLAPLAIPLALVWIYMLIQGYIFMRLFTSTALAVAIWVFGTSIKSKLSSPLDHIPQVDESYQSPTTCDENEEKKPASFELKSFVLFQSPLVFAGTIAIFCYLFYLTEGVGVDPGLLQKIQPVIPGNLPSISLILIAFRIAGKYMKFARYIMGGAVFLALAIVVLDLDDFFWSLEDNKRISLVFIGDWLYCEMKFAQDKLKTGKAWSYHYVAGFLVLVFYHTILPASGDLTEIYLPRVLWFIIIGSIVASFALKLSGQAKKRNLQVNLIIFFCLMQVHKKFIYFAFALSIMRIFTFIFKRTSFKNYLYPLLLGLLSYLGLWATGYDDLKLPRRFGPAFVGLRDFHLGSCLLLYSSAMLSTIILAMLFISFYSQELDGEDVQIGAQEEQSSVKIVSLKGHSTVIRKRNIIFFCFFYNILMIPAALKPVIISKPLDIMRVMETFLVDGAFYIFTITSLYFAF